jgi:hypothetical protein
VKSFPQAFTIGDNRRVALEFEALLRRNGLEVPSNSPLERAMIGAIEMFETHRDKSVHDLKTDCRDRWRQAFSLVEIARKILNAQSHPDFEELLQHLGLLVGTADVSQFSMIPVSASPSEKDTNNKVFELLVAAILFRMLSKVQLDKIRPSKRDRRNPDVIGEFHGKRWGFACKTCHAKNPKSFVERVEEGIDQIEKANVERGIVVVNLKNLIPHDEIWPATKDPLSGEWGYGAYQQIDATRTLILQIFSEFEEEVYALTGSRHAFVDKFIEKSAVPRVLMFYCSVAGYSPRIGVVSPMIVKQLTGAGASTGALDLESETLMDLFNDYLHDRID